MAEPNDKNLSLFEKLIMLLRENNGNAKVTIDDAWQKIDASYSSVCVMFRELSKRGWVTVSDISTGKRPKKQFQLSANFPPDDSWREALQGYSYTSKKQRNKKTGVKIDLKTCAIPTPDSKDIDVIAKILECYDLVKNGPARLQKLWDDMHKGDVVAVREQVAIIEKCKVK